jgi:hypothetical protein
MDPDRVRAVAVARPVRSEAVGSPSTARNPSERSRAGACEVA